MDARAEEVAEPLDRRLDFASIPHILRGVRVVFPRIDYSCEKPTTAHVKENAVKRQLALIAATWVAVVALLAGNAHAQSPTPPGGQFVLVGVVVLLEEGRRLAWVQEPTLTDNKIVTVRVGDSVGPYRVTKILTHQVEFTGPGGPVSVPLAGLPGAIDVASTAGTGQPPAGAQPPAGEIPPPPALSDHKMIVIPRGDPRRNFPVSEIWGAGVLVGGVASQASQPQASQPQASQPRAALAQDVAIPATPATGADATHNVIFIDRGDPRRNFPTSRMFKLD